MSLPTPVRRRAIHIGATAFSAIALAVGLSAGAASAQVPGHAASSATNPYSPAYQHPYRHGAVPTISQLHKMRTWAGQHAAATAGSATNLTYGGGIDGIGVTTGQEKVYLVFFGSQWGTKSTDGHGNVTLSGDSAGEAPYLQRMFKGLGTNSDGWSAVSTQYCDGAAFGAQTCSADTLHVAYPVGGVLAGVWVDESAASPSHAGGHQLAVEAVKAAKHFNNTTAARNRNAQYVIMSPHGTHPDGFPSTGFCAWHDWNGDRTLSSGGGATSHYGPIAFTNMPYLEDTNVCGENFLNGGPTGLLDGLSMVAGHEYSETISDQLPAGGWVNPGGEEDGDLCAWNEGPGAPAANLALATGSFAMQSLWGNDGSASAGTCEFTHSVVRNVGLFNGGFETGSFQGWTASGAASIVRIGAHTGKFAARAGKPTPSKGIASVSQTFNSKGTALSFWFNMSCPDTVAKSWGTVTLTDNTAHTTVTLLAKRCIKHSGWRHVKHTVIAGHSYTLRLSSHDDNDTRSKDGNFTLLDGVTNS